MLVEVISSVGLTNTILCLSKPSIGKNEWTWQPFHFMSIIRIEITMENLESRIVCINCGVDNNCWDANFKDSANRTDIVAKIVNNKTSTSGLIKWKGCHVHSNIYIRLVSCYLCVSYLVASVIIINLLCYSDLNLDITTKNVERILTGSIVSMSLVVISLLFSSCSLLSVLDCNRDSIREYTSCYEILCYHMLSLLVIFILSELMFIWVYFWSSSNITYSSSSLQVFQTTQDIRTSQTQDPNALTSTNTVKIIGILQVNMSYQVEIMNSPKSDIVSFRSWNYLYYHLPYMPQ
jgi:hypothetical protein